MLLNPGRALIAMGNASRPALHGWSTSAAGYLDREGSGEGGPAISGTLKMGHGRA
jgi:hypothetical protein